MKFAFIAGMAVLVLIIVMALVQRSRPRITTIETRREVDKEEDRDA
jgi:hypothetical protein